MAKIGDLFHRPEILTLFNGAILSIYAVLTVILLPAIVGLGPTAAFSLEFFMSKFEFYSNLFGIIVGVVGLTFVSGLLFRKQDEKLNIVTIHDPTRSFFNFGVVRNPFTLFFLSLLVFGFIWGLLVIVSQQTFLADIPVLEQQFTNTNSLFFSVYPATTSEDVGLTFVVLSSLLVLGLLWRRFKLKSVPALYSTAIGLSVGVGIAYGVILHFLRYGASESSLSAVAFFWGLSGGMIAAFGSVIPSLTMHIVLNFFIKVNELFSSDVAQGIVFTIWIVLAIFFTLYLIIFIKRINKRKQVGEKIIGK